MNSAANTTANETLELGYLGAKPKQTAAQKKAAKRDAEWRARTMAELANLRTQIRALRPTWSATKLDAIHQSYSDGDGNLGLFDILQAIKKADALAATFATFEGGK